MLERSVVLTSAAVWLLSWPAVTALADEGMWLFDRLPTELLDERYDFSPDREWAERIQRSAVRISSGGSGSFVSARGLVMTNHHVVSTCLQEISTSEANFVEEGFFARSPDEEVECPGTEILALEDIIDVTERVREAAGGELDPGAAEKARQAAIAAIEDASREETGLHSEVVTLYRGGEYHLYRYRRYDDVRMVMAPELDIAFFGGDADNFEFPRHCLDVAFLRVWEDGQPAEIRDHLQWAEQGASAGDLIFVAGHPGRTQRSNTVDHLRFLRDVVYPGYLRMLYHREVALQQFELRGPEAARVARDDLFSIENSRKALRGMLGGLLDPEILASKMRREARLRGELATSDDLAAVVPAWSRVRAALETFRGFYPEFVQVEGGRAFWSDLYRIASTIVRLVEEEARPNEERLPEFREALLPRVRLRLFSEAPIDPALEVAKLSESLTSLASALGADDTLVSLVLDGRAPAERARELVSGTLLADVERRKELVEGGREAVAASEDPMIRLARAVEPFARSLRTRYESLVRAVETEAYAEIARAEFAVTGASVYPDATFTLRLAFGVVKGWEEGGDWVEPFTTIAGAYALHELHDGEEPYDLPRSWLESRDKIDATTHFNFVSTADIIGGNSGSPVIDRDGKVVGLIFDGNIHSLVLDVIYTEEKARAVAVDAAAIVEALDEVYGMDGLVSELTGR